MPGIIFRTRSKPGICGGCEVQAESNQPGVKTTPRASYTQGTPWTDGPPQLLSTIVVSFFLLLLVAFTLLLLHPRFFPGLGYSDRTVAVVRALHNTWPGW